MLKTIIVCSVWLVHTAFAGWTNNVLPADDRFAPGRAIILHRPEGGLPAFKDALNGLVQTGNVKRLELITLHSLLDETAFQGEVFAELAKIAPRKLADAKRSAGKAPKGIIALRKVLDEAVVATPTVKSINGELATVGLHVSGSSHEKLTLRFEDGQYRLKCFLWLTVAPATRP